MLFITRNMREKTIIENGKRNDKTEYPVEAVRVLMFNDRLGIINAGGLYGNLTIDSLRPPGTCFRKQARQLYCYPEERL